jgi:hypothetical protein
MLLGEGTWVPRKKEAETYTRFLGRPCFPPPTHNEAEEPFLSESRLEVFLFDALLSSGLLIAVRISYFVVARAELKPSTHRNSRSTNSELPYSGVSDMVIAVTNTITR